MVSPSTGNKSAGQSAFTQGPMSAPVGVPIGMPAASMPTGSMPGMP